MVPTKICFSCFCVTQKIRLHRLRDLVCALEAQRELRSSPFVSVLALEEVIFKDIT